MLSGSRELLCLYETYSTLGKGLLHLIMALTGCYSGGLLALYKRLAGGYLWQAWLPCNRYNALCTRLQLTPETTEAMDEQEKFMASTAAELSSLAQQIAASQHTYEVLQSSQYITEEEESDVLWGMRRWPNKLAEVTPFCSALQ